MFDFRIIDQPDGTQIIDRSVKTSYDALTPLKMIEYIDVDYAIAYSDKIKRKLKAEEIRKKKLAYRLKMII